MLKVLLYQKFIDYIKNNNIYKHLSILGILHIFIVILIKFIFHKPLPSDSIRYLAVANEFASMKFQFSANLNCNTSPGYPILLAFIKPFTSHNIYLISIFQSILFVIAFLYFLNSIRLKYKFSDLNSLLLTVFLFLNPEIIHLNGEILSESLASSLILFICGSLINNLSKKHDTYIFILGLSLLVITKFEYILLIIVIFPFLYYIKRKKTIIVSSVVIICFLMLNGVKNHYTFDVFKITTFGSGTAIYGGNNLNLNGSWHIYGKTENYVPEQYSKTLDSILKLDEICQCIKQDSLYKRMAIDAWKTNYLSQIKVIPIKTGKLWLLPGNMDFYTGQDKIYGGLQLKKLFSDDLWPWYGKWKHGAYLLIYWLSLLLSFFGLYLKISKYKIDKFDILIISILIINTLMYGILFYGLGRFHLPVVSILFYYIIYLFKYFSIKFNLKNKFY